MYKNILAVLFIVSISGCNGSGDNSRNPEQNSTGNGNEHNIIYEHNNTSNNSHTNQDANNSSQTDSSDRNVTSDNNDTLNNSSNLNSDDSNITSDHNSTSDNNQTIDYLAPTITLKGANPLILELGQSFRDPGAVAVDDVDGNVEVKVSGSVDTTKAGTYTLTYSVTDSAGNSASVKRVVKVVTILPKNITDKIAVRFLNKATFGATLSDVVHLKELGVQEWLDEQFAMPKSNQPYLTKMIEIAKDADPDNNTYSVEEYLADNDTVFNKNVGSFHSPRFRLASWYDNALRAKDQLRHRTAYALSQIIVESDFEPIFTRRAEALARYFDILYDNALGSYKKLLTDISFNSGMSMFLTFNGSKKHYQNRAGIDVYPDENYAREIMQLFSIGLNKLNMDGTPIKDKNGNLIPTYTQEDVNELAKVFTGFDIKRNNRYGLVGFRRGDLTHRVEFTATYHDNGEKRVLGETIPAGLSGDDDVKAAIDIIFHQPSVAPYIAKKLIMRLTKSNPSPAYVQRVALAFKNSDFDSKEAVKAVFLDPELWDDLKSNRVIKFKEPQIAMTQFLRVFYAKPMPKWYFCGYGAPRDENASNCHIATNSFLFNDTRSYLGQGAGLAPTVFNFYDDGFIPNDENFKSQKIVAPELQIQTDSVLIKFSKQIYNYLALYENKNILDKPYWKNGKLIRFNSYEELFKSQVHIVLYYIGADKLIIDAKDEYELTEMVIDGDSDGDYEHLGEKNEDGYTDGKEALRALIDFEDKKLTGGMLSQEEKNILYEKLKDRIYNSYYKAYPKRREVYERIIVPTILSIVTSSKYMVE